MERTFRGYTWNDMLESIGVMLDIEDEFRQQNNISPAEETALDLAVKCIAIVANRMKNDAPIDWDGGEENG